MVGTNAAYVVVECNVGVGADEIYEGAAVVGDGYTDVANVDDACAVDVACADVAYVTGHADASFVDDASADERCVDVINQYSIFLVLVHYAALAYSYASYCRKQNHSS